MKIAILFIGQLRWFDISNESFNLNLKPSLEDHKVTYFANFWDSPNIKINEFKGIYNPIINIDQSKSIEEIKQYFKINNIDEVACNLPFQLYSFHRGFELLNNEFDLYIKLRTDLDYLEIIDVNTITEACHIIPTRFDKKDWACDLALFTKSFDNFKKCAVLGFNLEHIVNIFHNKNQAPDQYGDREDLSIPVYCHEQILAEYFKINNIQTELLSKIDLARHRQ